jgi:hypothetical protein
MSDTVFTQRMTMHINGGSQFSELHYEIMADGMLCGITRHTRTTGRPKYTKIADEFHAGDKTFDLLKTRGVGMQEWLNENAMPVFRQKAEGDRV